MFSSLLLSVYFILYDFYRGIYSNVFRLMDKIIFIYYLKEGKMKNITFHYYTGLGLSKYSKGTFYAKIIHRDGTIPVAFNGSITEIKNLNFLVVPIESTKRKRILLMNNDEPVSFNLEYLDNYQRGMMLFDQPVKNMKSILDFIGIKCSHVCEINHIPFSIKYHPIEELDIHKLYDK